MTELVSAIAALFAGVAIVPWLQKRRLALAALDGFVVVAIGGLVLVTLLPFSLHEAGASAAVAAIVGLVVPSIFERQRARADGWGSATTLLALAGLGLSVHAFLDGAALATSEMHEHGDLHEHSETLALAVILHRLPMGLVLGLLARSSPRVPWVLAVAVAGATALGFTIGQSALPELGLRGLAIFQALVAGSLMHVVFAHTPTELHKTERSTRLAGGVGALAGVALALYVGMGHPVVQHCHEELPAGSTLVQLSFEFAPAMILALVLAGIASALVRREQHIYLQHGATWSRPIRGLVSGLPLPISSCGILPIYRSLVEDRVPPSAALAFLIATPQIGLTALLITWPAFGPQLTGLRVAAAITASLLISVLLALRFKDAPAGAEHHDHHGHHHPQPEQQPPWLARLREGLRFGLSDLSDHLLPWLALGLILAALAEALVPEFDFGSVSPLLSVPLAALVGLPLYVCATGSTPLLAVLLHKGLSPGSALAFLITGPALNAETFALVSELHGRSRAAALGAMTLGVSIALGLIIDFALLESLAPAFSPVDHVESEASIVQQVALFLLLGLSLISLLRNGARGWLGQLQARYGEHVHHAVAAHSCDHDHGHAHAHDH